jgi:hypothetical protein
MKCTHCSQEVEPKKKFSIILLIFALILSPFSYGATIVIYLVYHFFIKKADTCPLCDNKIA